jgi:hypothetical protein
MAKNGVLVSLAVGLDAAILGVGRTFNRQKPL